MNSPPFVVMCHECLSKVDWCKNFRFCVIRNCPICRVCESCASTRRSPIPRTEWADEDNTEPGVAELVDAADLKSAI